MGSITPHSAGEVPAENFLELFVDTLQQLEPSAQGAFLQTFLKSLTGVDVSEKDSLVHWQGILSCYREMSERLGRGVNLRTAAAHYFSTALLLHDPVLLEFQELRRLRYSAATDPLTGLYNRRMFDEHMMRELNRSRRHGYPFALLLIDLRDFKKVNDTYGHAVGDKVLRGLARACNETTRGSDFAFRIGGDEFALLLPQTESQVAHGLGHRINQKFAENARNLAPDVKVGLDYGVAAFPKDGESGEKLFEAADHNVYAHKDEARHVVAATHTGEPHQASPMVSDRQPGDRRDNRISMEGTGARGLLHNDFGTREVKVLDLSPGGFSFLLDEAIQLPELFHVRLHMHIFHSEELSVRRVYSHRVRQGSLRVGCSFVT